MDTLSHIRRVARFVKSQERKALKKQMDGYNSLASRSRGRPHETEDSPDTIHDISNQLAEQVSTSRISRTRKVRSRTDRITDVVVCDEVRTILIDKCGLSQSVAREYKLDRLAKYLVEQWCENEGFNPDKIRPALLARVKRNAEQRVF